MVSLKVLFDEARERNKASRSSSKTRTQRNKTGFKWLTKVRYNSYKGYHWTYQRVIHRERIKFQARDLFRLFDKAHSQGYDWVVLDEHLARKTVESEGIQWEDYVDYMKSHGGFKQLVVNENGISMQYVKV